MKLANKYNISNDLENLPVHSGLFRHMAPIVSRGVFFSLDAFFVNKNYVEDVKKSYGGDI